MIEPRPYLIIDSAFGTLKLTEPEHYQYEKESKALFQKYLSLSEVNKQRELEYNAGQ